jgi:arylsulfatase A-like enzyme
MDWSRRRVLAGLGGVAAASGLSPVTHARSRPNFLFIMTDQQRHDALSCVGTGLFRTPNIDRLAASGVRFSHHFCAAPLCTPSRASLLTGLNMDRHGLTGNIAAKQAWGGTFLTWEEKLTRAGYRSRYFGKWHTGAGHGSHYIGGIPDYRGDYRAFYTKNYPQRELEPGEARDRYYEMPYIPLPLDRMMDKARHQGRYMPHHNEAGEILIRPEHTPTAHLIDEVIAALDQPTEPFSVTCSILSPHSPMLLPRPWFGRRDPASVPLPTNIEDDHRLPKPPAIPDIIPADARGLGSFIALYADMIDEVDHHIGRLLDHLDRSGLSERTVVVFTSDHGEMMGSHGTFAKSLLFDEAIRVPLIIRRPGQPGGLVDAALTSSLDVAPTLLSLAGIAPDDLPGRDLFSATPPPGAVVSELAFREEPHRARSIRTRRHKLILRDRDARLYNLHDDPGEQHNLLLRPARSRDHRRRAAELRDELVAWCEDNDAADIEQTARLRL